MTEAFDLKTRAAINDPAPIFAAMLAEQPVHYSAGLKGWVVADYDNVKLALTDERFSVEKMSPFADHMAAGEDAHKIKKLAQVLGGWMVFKDPPAHTRRPTVCPPAPAVRRPIPACARCCSSPSSRGKWKSCAARLSVSLTKWPAKWPNKRARLWIS